jgi:hypothetical protein
MCDRNPSAVTKVSSFFSLMPARLHNEHKLTSNSMALLHV